MKNYKLMIKKKDIFICNLIKYALYCKIVFLEKFLKKNL